MRIGMGYDVHQFVSGRPLVLCGVRVDYPLGLLGYSDADVALHAVADAILGAAALGDLGTHFPTGDERFRGMDSAEILRQVMALASAAGYALGNVDLTIVAQRPRLLGLVPEMRARLAEILGADAGQVSVKATTTDHLGFVGRKEGIAAQAVVLLV
jgi:2-C-methyl-D-erythritol 2,4-cyclodiphosphate synthase